MSIQLQSSHPITTTTTHQCTVYKVQESTDNLHQRWSKLFTPGAQLVIVYTGKTTSNENENDNTKKRVKVVTQICEAFKDSYGTVYVDRFYTSIDLMKALDKMKIYVTGTVMKYRLPKELIMAKNTK